MKEGRMAPRVFNLALYGGGGEFLASWGGPFNPGKELPISMEQKVGNAPSSCLGILKTKQIFCPRREMIYDAFVMRHYSHYIGWAIAVVCIICFDNKLPVVCITLLSNDGSNKGSRNM